MQRRVFVGPVQRRAAGLQRKPRLLSLSSARDYATHLSLVILSAAKDLAVASFVEKRACVEARFFVGEERLLRMTSRSRNAPSQNDTLDGGAMDG